MGDRLGIPGAVSFAFPHWAANTLLQASAFMRSPLPFKSDCCFFLPFAFSVTYYYLFVSLNLNYINQV